MTAQAEVSNKVRICAALILEITNLQARYQEIQASHDELARQTNELKRQRKELRQRAKGIDDLLTGARIKYDSIFLALQNQAGHLPLARQEQ